MSRECTVGEFSYLVGDDRWWWSDGMYNIFGFSRGDVVPTTELIAAHGHPDDAARVSATFRQLVTFGGPSSCYCRIVDASRRIRYAVLVGDGEQAADGRVTRLRGYLVEMTEARRRDAEAEAAAAVRGSVQHRAIIEQAKGVLMFVYAVDADTAFTLLCAVSQHRNVKLNQLAWQIMATAPANPAFPAATRRLTALLGHDPRRQASRDGNRRWTHTRRIDGFARQPGRAPS